MNREEWFENKWRYLRKFSFMAVVGVAFIIAALITEIEILAIGLFLVIPLLGFLVVVPLLHWKDRYIGEKSTLWGVLLLIETSGWFKIIYWFRHILPDKRKVGRYESVD